MPATLGSMPARDRKLPRHLSWPLTTTDIGDALGPHLSRVGKVWFGTVPNADGTLLRVEWVPALTSNYGGRLPAHMQGFQIKVLPTRATERAGARATLRQGALPSLDTWIAQALDASDTWLRTRHQRRWRLANGFLTHHDDDGDR